MSLPAWRFGGADICRDDAQQPGRVGLRGEAGCAKLDELVAGFHSNTRERARGA